MNRVLVTSSNVESVGYDAESETLEVAFLNGSVYQYFNVPEHLFHGLLAASSIGRYFDMHIKKGGFGFSQIR